MALNQRLASLFQSAEIKGMYYQCLVFYFIYFFSFHFSWDRFLCLTHLPAGLSGTRGKNHPLKGLLTQKYGSRTSPGTPTHDLLAHLLGLKQALHIIGRAPPARNRHQIQKYRNQMPGQIRQLTEVGYRKTQQRVVVVGPGETQTSPQMLCPPVKIPQRPPRNQIRCKSKESYFIIPACWGRPSYAKARWLWPWEGGGASFKPYLVECLRK